MIGVLFDFYDTLVEVDEDARRKWMFLKDMGYESSPELQAIWDPDGYDGSETPKMTDSPNYIDWRNSNICQMALQSGVPPGKVQSVVSFLIASERSFTVKAKKGAVQLISSLRNFNIPVGICSNWDDDIQTYLNQTDLPRFDVVITSADVGARKPHTRPFLASCDALGTRPTNTLFVGDSWECDVTGAIRSGLIPIWLSNAPHNPIPRILHMISSLEDVLEIVMRYLPEPRPL